MSRAIVRGYSLTLQRTLLVRGVVSRVEHGTGGGHGVHGVAGLVHIAAEELRWVLAIAQLLLDDGPVHFCDAIT